MRNATVALTFGLVASPARAQAPTDIRFIDNGQVRLGVNVAEGGAIVYLAQEGGANMVNNSDFGRQIQMSFYGGPVPFVQNGKRPEDVWLKIGWNPIQTGDFYGHPSRCVEFESKGVYMHLECVPMQWPLNNEAGDCRFEASIWLEGNAVHVHNRLMNHRADRSQFGARAQELPAIYSNGTWYRLMSYVGDKPFTNMPLTQLTRNPPLDTSPAQVFIGTENWAALVDQFGSGFGIVEPGVEAFGGAFIGVPGAGDEWAPTAGYLSPRQIEVLDSDIDYAFDYSLVVGSLEDIRAHAYAHVDRPCPPAYSFKADRQHWYYVNAVDSGWPIRGELRVKLENNDPQIISPLGFWHASDAPHLQIEAACRLHNGNAQVFWGRMDSPDFSEDKSLWFRLIPDGKYHRYTLNLSAAPQYKGVVTRLRLDPEPAGAPGDEVRIKWIRLVR